MAFCMSCGTNIPPGSGFCNSCGQPVRSATPAIAAAPGQSIRVPETTFFEADGVLVTNSRFVKGNETFAMSGVTSVRSHTEVPSKKGPIILIVIGVLVALGSMQASIGGLVLGVIMVVLGVLWFRSIKDVHYVRLVTASGERDAVSSFDMNYIGGIVGAVNQAIIHRG